MISDTEAREYAAELKDRNYPLLDYQVRDLLQYLVLKVQELDATVDYMEKEKLHYPFYERDDYDPDEG